MIFNVFLHSNVNFSIYMDFWDLDSCPFWAIVACIYPSWNQWRNHPLKPWCSYLTLPIVLSSWYLICKLESLTIELFHSFTHHNKFQNKISNLFHSIVCHSTKRKIMNSFIPSNVVTIQWAKKGIGSQTKPWSSW